MTSIPTVAQWIPLRVWFLLRHSYKICAKNIILSSENASVPTYKSGDPILRSVKHNAERFRLFI